MHTLSSASRTCMASASAVECTATVGDAELLAGTFDAKRDLSPVGDQDLVEHAEQRLASLDDRERLGIFDGLAVIDEDGEHGAGMGAGMWFMVFMASMMRMVWPAVTLVPVFDERRGAGLGRTIGGADHAESAPCRDGAPPWPPARQPRGPRGRHRWRRRSARP